MWQVCQSVSEYFGVNVIVFDDLKDKLVFADIAGCTLSEVLDLVTWLIGVEWVERGGQYYIGGNQSVIQVFPSFGIDARIESVFQNTLKVVNDKLVVQGSEREIKKVSDSLQNILNREVVKAQLKVIEVVYDDRWQLGLDWEKSFEYAVDWKNMLQNVHPATHLAMSAAASLRFDQAVISSRYLIDTELCILSGSVMSLNIGDEVDRPVYSESEYGNKVISGYNTQKTGLIIELKAYHSSGNWVFDSSVEHSRAVTDLQKTLSRVKTQVLVADEKPFLLANVSSFGGEHMITNGIPFLSRIPYLGFLFSVNDKITLRKDFYVCLRLMKNTSNEYAPKKIPVKPTYNSFDDFLNNIQQ